MNPYKTPCSPMHCDHYYYNELCGKESECQAYINYQALKVEMKRQKKEYGAYHEMKAQAVDTVYSSHRNTPKRVGQK